MSSLLWRDTPRLDPQCRKYGRSRSAAPPVDSPALCCSGQMDALPPDQQSLFPQHLHQQLAESLCQWEANIPPAAPPPLPMPSAAVSPHSQFPPPIQERYLLPVDLHCLALPPRSTTSASPASVLGAMGPSAPVALVRPINWTGCFERR